MADIVAEDARSGPALSVATPSGPLDYPISVRLDEPEGSSRWAALMGILLPVKILAVVPVVLLVVLGTMVQVLLALYGFWAAVCAGRYPVALRRAAGDILRRQVELAAWVMSYTDAYPAFGLREATGPVVVQAADRRGPGARYALWPFPGGARTVDDAANRWWAVLGVLFPLRLVAALPHYICVLGLSVAELVLGWIGFWIVLFGGRYPHGLWWFDSGVLRWGTRLWAFSLGLTDVYPPFSLA